MSDLHDLCKFPDRPIGQVYVDNLKYYLKNGIPSTYTVEEAYNYTNGIEEEPSSTTTPLHLIATFLPKDVSSDELDIVEQMVVILLEYGAGWCLTDVNGDTPGCILIKRDMKNKIYDQIVEAGVRAELLLRKVTEYDVEVIEGTENIDHEMLSEQVNDEEKEENDEEEKEKEENVQQKVPEEDQDGEIKRGQEKADDEDFGPAANQNTYLNTKLQYKDGALLTDRNDGVMMEWETNLMKLGADTLFEGSKTEDGEDEEITILNIGFGMGIIDTFIRQKKPTKQYICEPHPDVLAKLKQDGWYDDPNVVILEGRWQEKLDELLSAGDVFFNGIYYDTFSEHYSDMLELFDFVVGLLKPHGVFSFFNGLGADRQVVYEVYRRLVEIDLANYGLECTFSEVEVPEKTFEKEEKDDVWDNIKRPYWTCPVYYHPQAKFMSYE